MHCNPLRYQTKLYDERVNSFSIFSEEEQEFLQCYRWLRQLPEFFKPKELFSTMEDNQAKERIEKKKMFNSFDIENEKNTLYRCQCITGTNFVRGTVASAFPSGKIEHKTCFVI